MQIQQKSLAVLDQPVGVFEVGLALADRFHLGPAQRHAGFHLFQQKVVVARRPVMRRVALAAGHSVARLGRLLGAGGILFWSNLVTGLAGHGRASLNLHRSTGLGRHLAPAGMR